MYGVKSQEVCHL